MCQLDHYISQLTFNIKTPTLKTGDELMHMRTGVWALLTFPTHSPGLIHDSEQSTKFSNI